MVDLRDPPSLPNENEFRSPDFDVIKAKLKNAVIFDRRNLYDPKAVLRAWIDYFAIRR